MKKFLIPFVIGGIVALAVEYFQSNSVEKTVKPTVETSVKPTESKEPALPGNK
ncbi:hypothetical protein HT665_00600 [Ursidibacter maritimus]|uniref:Uncharacterized protein n=1 Tax=Ursidibacter maritimus TaxID=1331689 RepID=A0A949WEC8_9PAST|nr:hypothetical protein [Ursidibacter maritimus]MBV6524532.1 hypothetical protein [Ursidibacter maritimus]MBV6525034.1 hypothetical protein [Ursidibacter maritimus]MBV6527236.1 hypothetical protein [Ursidibacter maritimus]MBV6530082.1 hypothetical protein [Ursidibacter maritimus]MBV6530729.1 hypothetical protein [Ursidibacter maritimus]